MPAEPTPLSFFPEHLAQWAALRTAARWEKKLAEQLRRLGVPVFLPPMTLRRDYASKRRVVEIPLVSGFVFCSAPDFLGNPIVGPSVRSMVAQLIRAPDAEKLRAELKAIADLLTGRQLVEETPAGAGAVVRLVGRLLIGTQDPVLQTTPQRRQVVAEISSLGFRQEVEIVE